MGGVLLFFFIFFLYVKAAGRLSRTFSFALKLVLLRGTWYTYSYPKAR